MAFIPYIFLTIWLVGIALTIYGTHLALKKRRAGVPNLDYPFNLYPVSILKPLKGADGETYFDLRSFFTLQYPRYELIFSVANSNDRALSIVELLKSEFPNVQTKIVTGQTADCNPQATNHYSNPKIANLVQAYSQAQHDLILISDSNVRVRIDYLTRMVAHFDSGVGIVTAVLGARDPQSIAGILQSTMLNTFYSRAMHLAERFSSPCVMGKSMLFSRHTANRFGGISTLSKFLAEDYMAGVAMRQLGLRNVIMTDPVIQHMGNYTFKDFWQRNIRWGQIRKIHAPIVFLFEPFFTSLGSAFCGALAVASLCQFPLFIFSAIHFSLWFYSDLKLTLIYEKPNPIFAIIWLFREALHPPLWLASLFSSTVTWRGNQFEILKGGIIGSRVRSQTIN